MIEDSRIRQGNLEEILDLVFLARDEVVPDPPGCVSHHQLTLCFFHAAGVLAFLGTHGRVDVPRGGPVEVDGLAVQTWSHGPTSTTQE